MILEILVERTQTATLLLKVTDRASVTKAAIEQGVKDSITDYEWEDPTITSFTVLGEANPEDVAAYKIAKTAPEEKQ